MRSLLEKQHQMLRQQKVRARRASAPATAWAEPYKPVFLDKKSISTEVKERPLTDVGSPAYRRRRLSTPSSLPERRGGHRRSHSAERRPKSKSEPSTPTGTKQGFAVFDTGVPNVVVYDIDIGEETTQKASAETETVRAEVKETDTKTEEAKVESKTEKEQAETEDPDGTIIEMTTEAQKMKTAETEVDTTVKADEAKPEAGGKEEKAETEHDGTVKADEAKPEAGGKEDTAETEDTTEAETQEKSIAGKIETTIEAEKSAAKAKESTAKTDSPNQDGQVNILDAALQPGADGLALLAPGCIREN